MIDRVRSLLARISIDPSGAAIEALEGGMTNKNFRVDLPDRSLVVRLGGKGTGHLGIDRACERRAGAIAAAAGIGAEVLLSDPDEDVLITGFIEGEHVSPESIVQPEVMRRVVRSIRTIHEGPDFPCTFSPFAFVRHSVAMAVERKRTLPEGSAEAVHKMARLELLVGDSKQLRACHNDLLPANLVDDGRTIRIIDWEYAAMSDPWFELGNLACHFELDDAGGEHLLALYFDRPPTEEDMARLALMRLTSDLRDAFWGFLKSTLNPADVDNDEYGRRYLERFHKDMADL